MSTDRYHLDPAAFAVNGRTPSVVYGYVDRDGNPLGAVARFESTPPKGKKTFLQYRYENGKYLSGLDGRRLPLNRLPEVLAAITEGKDVCIAEGEKAVDRLVEAGFAATTNPGGAGKWRAEDSILFKGAKVVVLADSDPIGRAHAQAVAASLHGIAASVKVIELPHEQEGDDLVEWFERGGTAELLSRCRESEPEFVPPAVAVQVGEAWPEPIPFVAASDPAPFPLADGLPGNLAEIAAAIAEVVRLDVTAPAVLLPTAISGAAGNAFSIRVSPSHIEPNLSRLTAALLESGERKSALFRRLTDPYAQWASALMPEYLRELRQYEDELELYKLRRAKALKAQSKQSGPFNLLELPPSKPRQPLPYVSDITMPEVVRRTHANGGAVFMQSADARHVVDSILGQHRSDGQVDDSVILRAHAGDYIDRARVGSGGSGEFLTIEKPSIALAIVIQSDKIEQLVARRETSSSGLIARINFAQPLSKVGKREETGQEKALDVEIALHYESGIREILDERFRIIDRAVGGPLEPIELCLDPEAMERRRAFHNHLESQIGKGRPLDAAQAIVSKCAGEAARLAGLFHLYELTKQGRLGKASSIPVPARTWHAAEVHQRWQLFETIRVLEMASEDAVARTARRLIEWAKLRLKPDQAISARDAIGERRVHDGAEFEQAIAFLEERGWVRGGPLKGKEEAPRWIFHPSVFGGGP